MSGLVSYSLLVEGNDLLVEEVPANLPEPCEYGMIMRTFVDADHAGDLV
jgi:hypothetical protein